MIIEELVAVLAFEIDDKPLRKFQEGVGNLVTSVAAITAAAIGAGGALFATAKGAADAGDNALKMSQRVGVGIEKLQELMYAGKLADVSNEQLGTGLKILNKNIEGAASGSKELAKDFGKVGVSVKNTDGTLRSADEVLYDLADRFQNMPDGAQKTATAMALLGKSGSDMIPLLNGGSKALRDAADEAREFGLVIDADSAKLSEEFNDNLTRTQQLFAGMRNIVGTKLIPIINQLNLKFMAFFKANRAVIESKIDRFFTVLANVAEKSWRILSALWDSANGLAEVFGGMENVIKAAATAFLIFAGASVLYNLGKMVGLIANLGHMLTLANAKALLIPILIGAAIVAVGLIIEDIIAFFQGRDSVTGIIVEKFKAAFAFLEEGFAGLGTVAKVALAIIMTPLRGILNTFQNILDIISVLRGKLSFMDAAKNIGNRMLNTFGVGTTDSLRGAMGLPAMASAPNASAAAGVTPNMGEMMALTGGGSNQNNTITMPVTVQVGDNANPFEVGREVSKQTSGGLEEVLRGTQRSYVGQAEY